VFIHAGEESVFMTAAGINYINLLYCHCYISMYWYFYRGNECAILNVN